LEIKEKHWSEEVSKLSVWLSGLVAFETAAEILERVGGVHISGSSVWHRSQKWGESLWKEEERIKKAAQKVELRNGVVAGEAHCEQRMGVSMDGAMMNIRGEGWKEFKVGVLFEVGEDVKMDEQTREELEVGCALNNTYVAHLGGPEDFGYKLWAEAQRRRWTQAADTQIVADGAAWIWNLVREHFYDSQQIVDWYHAKQHLYHAAELLHREDPSAMQRWLNVQETALFQGHAGKIAASLHQHATQTHDDTLRQEAGYFEHHQHRMDYLEMRIQRWVIGSGSVESGAKQYKSRLTGPGMRWSRKGAERMLPIRSAVLGQRFDHLWRTVYKSPQN